MPDQLVQDWIANVRSKAKGRTRYEGQEPYRDEAVVAYVAGLEAEVERLRREIDALKPTAAHANHTRILAESVLVAERAAREKERAALRKAVDEFSDAADRIFKIGKSAVEAMGPEFEEPASQIFAAAGIVRQYEADARAVLASTDAGTALLDELARLRELAQYMSDYAQDTEWLTYSGKPPEEITDLAEKARAALSGTRTEGEG